MELTLKDQIQDLMDQDCFCLLLQPLLDFSTNTVTSAEALSRLRHPERGLIFPDEFLPAVEAAGLAEKFDLYIFERSCKWMKETLQQGRNLSYLSCNFSRKTLSGEDLAAKLVCIADNCGLSHDKIAIEITEQEAETDYQAILSNLELLKAEGFRILLDDYGVGVTSVKDMMRYPLDTIKIDRSILNAADTNQGRTVYQALVGMTQKLGLQLVCEGIETAEQAEFAKEAGCNFGQGYHYCRPVYAEQFFDAIHSCSILDAVK